MRNALLLAAAAFAAVPVIAQTGTMPPTDPPIPETPAPPAPPETPAPPPAPMPPAQPAPEIPPPTPTPPSQPGPVVNVSPPRGPMATPPSAGMDTADSGATTNANLQPVPSTKTYPVCTRKITDNCINRGGK